MSMSKKHFIQLADQIRYYNKTAKGFGMPPFSEGQILVLAEFCQSQNPNFNSDRWLSYIAGKCGPNGEKVKV